MNPLLNLENSRYLKQHAHDPIHWQTWSAEAWQLAQSQNKLVIVSIGYASCEGCQRMAEKVFKNPYVADLMNTHFVCIKVDREEYPAIDHFYLEAVQMITGKGGWPLNVFCFPDGRPFMGGTYFPAVDEGNGLVPWPQLLMRILDHYQRDPQSLEENAEAIIKNAEHFNQPPQSTYECTLDDLLTACKRILKTHDDTYGGFGVTAKFPQALVLESLMAATENLLEPDLLERIQFIVDKTLTAMAHSPLYDQLRGGFMRYTIDREWQKPHSEKMLYDNAVLMGTYAKGYRLLKNPYYLKIIDQTLAYLDQTLKAPNGLYYASQSPFHPSADAHFYQWTLSDVKKQLSPENFSAWTTHYMIPDDGQSHFLSFKGSWLDYEPLKRQRDALRSIADQRPQPPVDDKLLVGWNALLASRLIEVGLVLNDPSYTKKGQALLDVLLKLAYQDGCLSHVLYGDQPYCSGDLFDYATVMHACMQWVSTFSDDEKQQSPYVAIVKALMHSVILQFKDPVIPGFLNRLPEPHLKIIPRAIWQDDNTLPSSNGLLFNVLSDFKRLLNDPTYDEAFQVLKAVYTGWLLEQPNTVAYALGTSFKSFFT